MQIEYDPAKNESNRRKHGMALADAARFEWDTARIEEDTRFDYPEQRFEATGVLGDAVCVVIYCDRGQATRIISLREAKKHEIRRYVRYLEGR